MLVCMLLWRTIFSSTIARILLQSRTMASHYAHSTDITFWLFLMVAHFACVVVGFFSFDSNVPFFVLLVRMHSIQYNAVISMPSDWMQFFLLFYTIIEKERYVYVYLVVFKWVYEKKIKILFKPINRRT